MTRTKVLSVVGTRPEAIKMAPVVRALRASPHFESRVCVTGQHEELLRSALMIHELYPDHDLRVHAPKQSLHDVFCRVVIGVRDVLSEERADIVLVQGDTTTTAAAALGAFYARVTVGHVEAGLRTGSLESPWPEEGNRLLTTRLATWHFAPTTRARDALLAEGLRADHISVVGNTAIDALMWLREQRSFREWKADRGSLGCAAALFDPGRRPAVVLVTVHRRESFNEGLRRVCAAIRELSARHRHVDFVFPIHPNPAVEDAARSALSDLPNVHLLGALPHTTFVHLLDRSSLVLTDSGGVQEEASALGKPVLVVRDVTDRPEPVAAGVARLVGTDTDRIVDECSRVLEDPEHRSRMSRACSPYGDGAAGRRIVEVLSRAFAEER